MRAWVFSDVHLRIAEAEAFALPFAIPDADVAVVAGDVCDGMEASLRWLGRVVRPHMRVVTVLGNHEFFGWDVPSARRRAASLAAELGLDILDDASCEIGGVRFVGGTLWTDFRLFEHGPSRLGFDARSCMYEARRRFADYDEIWATEAVDGRISRHLLPKDTVSLHEATAAFLERESALACGGVTVVVTHHAPSPASVHPDFAEDPTSAAYASDMNALVERWSPSAWIHGHMHSSLDYRIGETRVLCNPRGYAVHANPGFVEDLIVQV